MIGGHFQMNSLTAAITITRAIIMNKKSKAIIFDVGGVLLDYNRGDLLSRISRMCSPQTGAETVASLLSALELSRGVNTPRTFYNELKDQYGLSISYEELANYWNGGLASRDWVPALLTDLSTQTTLIILSDTNAEHWDHITENILDLNLFSHVFVSHHSGMIKDSRAIFDHVIKEIAFAPEQLLFIDDTLSNTIHATACGITSHHFKNRDGMLTAIEAHLDI
jgi:FMN phosphatase YigB (HAD superfamily)